MFKELNETKKKPVISDWFYGGAYRIRTGDLYNANVARYRSMPNSAHAIVQRPV